MRNWTLRLIAPAALSTATLPAQDIIGTWQGTLTPADGKELRGVFKISKDARGCLFHHAGRASCLRMKYVLIYIGVS